LLSFLLNTHPQMVTIGHSTGWDFGQDEDYRCSCGERLVSCPFYQSLGDRFRENGLPFDIRRFGTEYRLSSNDTFNRWLTGSTRGLGSSLIERTRDTLLRVLPGSGGTLRRQDRANRTLIEATLEHSGAEIFVDNSHYPDRLRHLRHVRQLEIKNVHLVRDPRGVVLSNMIKKGWKVEESIELWLRQQGKIIEAVQTLAPTVTIHYEDLCDNVNETLAQIHSFAGVQPRSFSGDFKSSEHHILGNVMRFGEGKIKKDARWKEQLAPADLDTIVKAMRGVRENPRHPLAGIVSRYLDQT
jgi:hypothetical protein